ncbi:hypothetical protein ACFSR7_15470 [Cohnella sp. GCM10020058]|uniref:hypothetical protein n=1 Tax=Cohnella sp. GCM10020058 TaxID=3317330 RepID=UPI003634639E
MTDAVKSAISMLSLLMNRGHINFKNYGCPTESEISELIARLSSTPPTTPVQGYREAIKRIDALEIDDPDTYKTLVKHIAAQALSQTDIQPSGVQRVWELWEENGRIAQYTADPDYYLSRRYGIRKTLDALGITIPGINSTEDDQSGPSISSTRLMLDGQTCGVCNYVVPLDHAQIGRLEADGTRTPYHMGCEYEANRLKPCEDCGHHRKFCTDCADPSTEQEDTN